LGKVPIGNGNGKGNGNGEEGLPGPFPFPFPFPFPERFFVPLKKSQVSRPAFHARTPRIIVNVDANSWTRMRRDGIAACTSFLRENA
jgi:hypothetical protein